MLVLVYIQLAYRNQNHIALIAPTAAVFPKIHTSSCNGVILNSKHNSVDLSYYIHIIWILCRPYPTV